MAEAEQLRNLIQGTLSSQDDIRKSAEDNLTAAQKTPGYASHILRVVATQSSDSNDPVRQAAAVHFKNTIKKGWDLEDAQENGIIIDENERQTIKTHLVQLMCSTPDRIQVQISEAISIIAKLDYPDKWKNLLPELVNQFNSPDQLVVNGVLKTANAIFKSFRYVQRSDELYRVILFTLEGIQAPLLGLLKHTSQALEAAQKEPARLQALFETLRLICRIAYSLVYQDLPEYFEDHMGEWMEEFAKYLQPNIFPLMTDPDEEENPSPLDKAQAAIIAILSHYTDKDEETFNDKYLAQFMQLVWHLLLNVTAYPKHDILATTSMKFITGLVAKPMHAHLFKDVNALRQIVTQIVIPSLYFRESDEERFEDDPHDFMLTEVEGSDSETRRRCSQDCLKAMCRQFEPTTNICLVHIKSMIEEDVGGKNWKAKDAAINLMMGIAIRAESMNGVSQINPAANLMEFFQSQVLPELQDTNHQNRFVVKATCIKFTATFRNQFTREHIVQLLPMLISHLSSPVVVVHTFAAYAVERMLVAKDEQNAKKVRSAELMPVMESLFQGLFTIIANTANENDNDYAMKCVTRSLATCDKDVLPVVEIVLAKLTETLGRVAKNPQNPQFNHYLFEAIAVLIRNVCSVDANATSNFESLLFPPFNIVLQMEVDEFTPYVFQIMAQLLEYRPKEAGLGDAYEQLFPPLMTAQLWEKGKVPALARLVQAYLRQAGPSLVQYTEPILGIFQKLLLAKATHEHSFMILNAAVAYFPPGHLSKYSSTIFQLIFTRLQKQRHVKFVSLVCSFFAIFIGKYGGQEFLAQVNGLQSGMAAMVIKDVWANAIKNSPPLQRTLAKTEVIGLTRLLCEDASILADTAMQAAWAHGIGAAAKLVSSPALKDSGVVAGLGDDEDYASSGYDAQFSQLQYAKRPVDDPFKEIADPVAYFCQAFNTFSGQHPGRLGPLLKQGLAGEEKLGAGFEALVNNGAVQV